MASWSVLDAELADTLEAVRARRGLPSAPARRDALARDLVGAPKPPTVGVCCFCGAIAPAATVCDAHSDLPALDGCTSAVVTTNTNGHRPHSLDGSRAADGQSGAS